MAGPPQKPDLQARLREVPHKPGVYLMRDRLDTVIYVGKARDLRKRLANYFTPSRKRLAEHKTRSLIHSIWNFEFHEVRNEPEAILLEGKLIKKYRPKYNVSFRDDKRFLLVRVHPGETWPRFHTTRVKREDGARYFGPFAHSGALRKTLDWLNREFGLRTCRPAEPGENDYRHCHDDVIRNCSAPCVGRISREDYLDRVERASDFLKGHAKEQIEILENEMLEAAEALDFEQAAKLRDRLESLRLTLRPTRQFRRGSLPGATTRDPQADVIELQDDLGMADPPRVMECFDISNISETHCVASMVRFRDGVPDKASYRRYRIRSIKGQDDFAAMAEVVRRRYSRILLEARESVGTEVAEASQESPLEQMRRLEQERNRDDAEGEGERESRDTATPRRGSKPFVRLPDLVIVDGGKGQLKMAVGELAKLGLHDLPVIGLAKQREEIFRPGQSAPLRLSHEAGSLQLLQRIRDEAHRFANGYHQLLMKRRVEESLLDDCPGVSQARKQRLLQTFGSVRRLRQASAESIAEIEGIGPQLASRIVEFLDVHR